MRRLVVSLSFVLACAGDPAVPGEEPAAPATADPRFQIAGARGWYLAGDALAPGAERVELAITAPDDTRVIDAWLDGAYAGRVHAGAGTFDLAVPLAGLAIGEHRLRLAADAGAVAFAELGFQRSHALYVAVSNDWDTGDHTDDKLERQDRLHARHPHLVLTHFVGPYTFTDPTVSAARADQLVRWLLAYRTSKGDEIGLHIHPHCHFVEAAGVTCRVTPSFAYQSDASGRTVVLSAYTRDELARLLAKADELFVAHGLGKPTSFRAGGWTATGDVLAELELAGHVTDASGCNWARLEEWVDVPDATIYQWNQAHWGPIDDTSQPYYPSVDDLLVDSAPHRAILEAPDNGALVDYVTSAEMIEMFEANFDGRALTAPRHYSIGYHPINFSEGYFRRIDEALTEIDAHLAVDGRGPVVYVRMSDLPKAFPRP